MAPIHVDEKAGSDTTGQGTPDQPYETLAFALFTHPHQISEPAPQFLIRKDSAGTYEDPTQSALKKAKKGADGLEKKRKKAEEATAKDAQADIEEKERREKLLAESKKIVLKDDDTLPKPTRVSTPAGHFLGSSPFIVLVGETRVPGRFAIAARPCVRMGPSPSFPKGNELHSPQGWHWIPSSLVGRSSGNFRSLIV